MTLKSRQLESVCRPHPPQVEIETGDVGSYHHVDPVARLLERLGSVDLRLDTARDLAEDVDFPLRIETAGTGNLLQARAVVAVAQGLRDPPLGFVSSCASAGAAIELRKLLRAEHNQLQPRLLQTIQRDLEIEIILDCKLDQLIELMIVQRTPPLPPLGAAAVAAEIAARGSRAVAEIAWELTSMGRMSPRGHAICPRAPNVIAATRVEKVFYVPAGTRLWGFIEGLVRPIIGSAIIRPIGWVSTHVMFACRSYFEPSIQQSATSRAELSFAF